MEREYRTGPIGEYIEQLSKLHDFRISKEPYYKTLTDREVEVLRLISCGMSNSEMSKKLEISLYTVQNHRARIRDKLNIKHQVDFIKYALAFNLINF